MVLPLEPRLKLFATVLSCDVRIKPIGMMTAMAARVTINAIIIGVIPRRLFLSLRNTFLSPIGFTFKLFDDFVYNTVKEPLNINKTNVKDLQKKLLDGGYYENKKNRY